MDKLVSINHPNLVGSVFGLGKTVVNEKGTKGVNIFIPTKEGEILLLLLEG